MKPWKGVWDAGDFGSYCMAFMVMGQKPYNFFKGQEDCLFLNIYTPRIPETELKDEELLDVIFFIHGGAFIFGKSNSFGAKYFMDRNVIFVTFNYRVGALGVLPFKMCLFISALNHIQRILEL